MTVLIVKLLAGLSVFEPISLSLFFASRLIVVLLMGMNLFKKRPEFLLQQVVIYCKSNMRCERIFSLQPDF